MAKENKIIEFGHNLRQIFSGKSIVSDYLKFSLLGYVTALFHVIFVVFFICGHNIVLTVYNIFVIIFYLYGALYLTRNESYSTFYYSAIFEIILHSALASIILGWNLGFMTYTLAVIPLSYYFGLSVPEIRNRLKQPAIIAILEAFSYFGVLIITDMKHDYPALAGFRLHDIFLLKYFNSVIAIYLFVLLSMLFSLEIRYMHHRLEIENSQLEVDAGHDMLTGLINRRGFESLLEQAKIDSVRYNRPFGLAMCDIDHFKNFNDTYGHDCGDEVLVAISKAINQNVRERDAVCRWGGEEILVLINGAQDELPKIAERIRKGVEDIKFSYDGNDVTITMTVGLAICDGASCNKDLTIKEMIDQADANLYYGKHHGRNCVIV